MRTIKMLCTKSMKEFGDKNKLCFAVGKLREGALQQIDVWASNELLTPIDNMAYLPQFIATLESEKLVVASGQIAEDYLYFNHGPTTDNVSGKISVEGNTANLTFELNGIDISVVIEAKELLSVYSHTIEYLRSINA